MSRGHDCSRDPRVVRIVLLDGERVLQQKELPFPDAFVELSPGTYQSRDPVIVEVRRGWGLPAMPRAGMQSRRVA